MCLVIGGTKEFRLNRSASTVLPPRGANSHIEIIWWFDSLLAPWAAHARALIAVRIEGCCLAGPVAFSHTRDDGREVHAVQANTVRERLDLGRLAAQRALSGGRLADLVEAFGAERVVAFVEHDRLPERVYELVADGAGEVGH